MNTIHIVGAGPAGLMAAYFYALKGHSVKVFDHKAAPGRKFLVAGHGGFNLTHSEELELFLSRYDSAEIREIVRRFNNQDTLRWLNSIGIPTYIGSSGKIFPAKGIKPIQVLKQWIDALTALKVEFFYAHKLIDFNLETLRFAHAGEFLEIPYHRAVLAFGGKSWSRTGSDGSWLSLFQQKGISVLPLEPSNSGFETRPVIPELEGLPVKNIRLFNSLAEKRGEMLFTSYGIEGSAVYYMNRYIRPADFPQLIYLDLLPQHTEETIIAALSQGKITEALKRKLNMKAVSLSLLKSLDRETYTSPEGLARKIKAFPLELTGFRPMDEVISTFGGVDWHELHPDLSLKQFPAIQCCGEMLNWDAPTGGYLLQACFASGYFAALKD